MKNKILAVDDSKMMLRIIARTIEMLDYEPLHAADGVAALQILEEHGDDVALILLDWNMPVMDGYETLLAIREKERFKDVPVMMVTTESEKARVIKAIQAGAQHYLCKPFNQQDLAIRIMECLGKGL